MQGAGDWRRHSCHEETMQKILRGIEPFYEEMLRDYSDRCLVPDCWGSSGKKGWNR
jgi:hypothetical protein